MLIGSFLNASSTRINTASSSGTSTSSSPTNSKVSVNLTASEQALVLQLQSTDTKVRAHENAHIAAGGGVITSDANFTYQEGSDNALYAVAGEVGIDASEGATPEETIVKMQTIRAAALAPSDPSSTDYQVASTASILEMQARLEISRAKQAELLAKPQESYLSVSNEESPAFSNNA